MSALEFWHHHVGVSVPDLEASIAWYGHVLGFTLVRRLRIESRAQLVVEFEGFWSAGRHRLSRRVQYL